jgi:hypothetical protein
VRLTGPEYIDGKDPFDAFFSGFDEWHDKCAKPLMEKRKEFGQETETELVMNNEVSVLSIGWRFIVCVYI